MFASADLLLLNQVGAVKHTVIPSKLLTYMAAGKTDSPAGGIKRREPGRGTAPAGDRRGGSRGGECLYALRGRSFDSAGSDRQRGIAAIGASVANRTFATQHFDRRLSWRGRVGRCSRTSCSPGHGCERVK